jgi:tetratricopeptide (TPR) repeat protein
MGITKEEALMIDHQRARDYIGKYQTAITNAFISRVAILNGAIQDFNSFRDLPPESNAAAAIWDLAFGILSAAVPALRLGEFLKKQYERADVALKAAEAFGQKARRADKVIKVVTKGADVSGQAANYGNQVKDILEKAEKVNPELKGKVTGHVSRGPIKELIKDLQEAPKVWEKAIEAETKEWENRLADLPAQGGSLEDKVKGLLTLPEVFGDEEVDEIWTIYLFEMVLAHCQAEVYWVHTITDYGYGQKIDTYELEGINGNQRQQIVDWFGPSWKRGKYAKWAKYRIPIHNFEMFLGQWSVREVVKRRSQTWDIRAKV